MSITKQIISENTGTLTEPSLMFLNKVHPAIRAHLATTTTLQDFLSTAGELSLDECKLLVKQALLLIGENYVHRQLKEAMHGINPVQRLRLLKYRLEQSNESTMGSEYAFHREMLEIFNSLRDLHTIYTLPKPFCDVVAWLPFQIEGYFDEKKKPHYIATHFVSSFPHRYFKEGVEIITWNGVPIMRMIELISDRYAGSNMAARHIRGVNGLCTRVLKRSLPPDESWVTIGYIDRKGNEREMRQKWFVVPSLPDITGVGVETGNKISAAHLGIDLEGELVGRAKKMLFKPAVIAEERTTKNKKEVKKSALGEIVEISMPFTSKVQALFITENELWKSESFGYIRIFSFYVDDSKEFVEEFIRLLERFSQLAQEDKMDLRGLIIDVRGNAGGNILASEGLLQLLTPKRIEPEPFQFINTPLNLQICGHSSDLTPWEESLKDAVRTGAIYSRSFPITPIEFANRWGQKYDGPVVLITDAQCYSATDIFIAGFIDHEIGTILGVDDNTGAGGANVWKYSDFQDLFQNPDTKTLKPDSPYVNLPKDADISVALRRSLRVGMQAGTPVEDLGIQSNKIERHFMTKDDLLHGNINLIEHAIRLLKEMACRQMTVAINQSGATINIEIHTKGISSIDVYVDGRHVKSLDINSPICGFNFKVPPESALLELKGYDGREYVAARKLFL